MTHGLGALLGADGLVQAHDFKKLQEPPVEARVLLQVQRRVGDEERRPHHINVRLEHHRDGDERGAEVPEAPRARVRMDDARVAARLAHERDPFS